MNFATSAVQKFIENCLSVKIWIIFSYMLASLVLVYMGKMEGVDFATSNGSVISIVLAIREGIKVAKIREIRKTNGDAEKAAKIEKMSI